MADKYLIHGATYKGDGTTSSEAAGATVTITIATPGVVSWTAHGKVADDPVYFSTTGALPTGLTAGTRYYVRNPSTDAFEVSATAGGASIATSGTQSGTHSAYGPGAWNDIAIFHGTSPASGSVAAGDVVYIRSKTSAGADLTITLTANINMGLAAATETALVTWIIDNGAVWSGIDGKITYAAGSTNWAVTLLSNNELYCSTQDSVTFTWTTSGSQHIFIITGGAIASRFCLDGTAGTSNGRSITSAATGATRLAIVNSPHFILNRFFGYLSGLIAPTNYSKMIVNDPLIEINDMVSVAPKWIFGPGAYGAFVEVNGGRLTGSFVTTGFKLADISTGSVLLNGFQYPNTITMGNAPTNNGIGHFLQSFNCDAQGGGDYMDAGGEYTSRANNNPPVLNAVRPDSGSSGWSWKLYPVRAAPARPLTLRTAKTYTDTAAALTLTAEILVATTMSANNQNTWLQVVYVDNATGVPKTVTNKCSVGATPAALGASTAVWSATTWGAISFDRKKLSVTTPTSVKKDTVVEISLITTLLSATQNDVMFVDPDVQIS